MDFPVEATVLLHDFPNKSEALQILGSHGLTWTPLSGDQVRAKGTFLQLRAAKASLEPLRNSPTKMDMTPEQQVSSGAVPKHYTNHSSGTRGRFNLMNKTFKVSSPSPNTNFFGTLSFPNKFSDLRHPSRTATESFNVDTDVFMYADRMRKNQIDSILDSHNVRMNPEQNGDNFRISVVGKNAAIASGKLQSLLHDLIQSLRTQDVPLRDMDPHGWALLDAIHKRKNIYGSVLVCEMPGQLHLIGPSRESYELKQSLLGDRSGRTGRTLDRANAKRRSSSLPSNLKNAHRDNASAAYPPPAGAAGYTPSRYQDVRAEPEFGAVRQTDREKTRQERGANDVKFKSFKKSLIKTFSPGEIRRKIKSQKPPWKP